MISRVVGLVVTLVLLLTGALIWQRSDRTSDGSVVQLSNRPWRAAELRIDFVVGPASPLRPGDVLIRIDGYPVDEAAGRVTGGSGTHIYTVRRGERLVAVPVQVRAFALRSLVLDNPAALLFLAVLLAMGGYVHVHRRRDPAARSLLITAVLTCCGTVSWLLGADALTLARSGPSGLQTLGEVALALVWGALLHFVLVLPGSELRVRRWLVAFCYALPLLLHAGYLAITLPTAGGQAQRSGLIAQVSLAPSTVLPSVCALVAVLSYRSMRDPAARRRVRWVLIPFYGAVAGFAGVWTVPPILGRPVPPVNLIPVLFLPCTLAIGAAVLRYGWFDIELIVRRSLLYGSLTGAVLVVFLGASWVFGHVVGPRSGTVTLFAGGLVALTAQPLLLLLQRRVGRILYGDRADPYEILAEIGRIEAATHPQQVFQSMVESLAQTLRVRYVAVELGAFRAACGRPLGAAVHHDLIHGNQVWGRLVLEPGEGREPFGRADQQLLDVLVRQVGAAASAVLIGARLQASREQLVLAREEERRQLHHRLHDGLGPALAATAFQMEIARAHLSTDPDAAVVVLHELGERLTDLRADVGRIVSGQRPAVLDRLGLAAAIRDRAGRQPAVRVEERGDLGGLPAAVEAAAYWIAVEAVHNAGRHGAARHCRVILTPGGELTVEVLDDGTGLPVPVRPGGGFASMRDRAEELGGRWTCEPGTSGGTRVVAVLPATAQSQASLGPWSRPDPAVVPSVPGRRARKVNRTTGGRDGRLGPGPMGELGR